MRMLVVGLVVLAIACVDGSVESTPAAKGGVTFAGKVESVSINGDNSTVRLYVEGHVYTLSCYGVPKTQAEKLGRGDRVKLRCKSQGTVADLPVGEDCTVQSVQPASGL
jgi:hypothetical protein